MTNFYSRLRKKRGDDENLATCIERVVTKLNHTGTSADQPGMLLGKIQSGKTRGFLGVIAYAFDSDYDIAIVLTKGTKTLSEQTVMRIANDFSEFVQDDEISIFDIMKLPPRLTKSERSRKLVIVAKKQVKNLERLLRLFEETYPDLRERRTLLIDDEADLASVRFVKNKETREVEQGRISGQMDTLRKLIPKIAFLQVTATPYALYLQPENYELVPQQNFIFLPKRPAFTELLPIHSGYVGGADFFGEFDNDDARSHIYVNVPIDEQDVLRRPDGRSVRNDNLLGTKNLQCLRRALLTFLVGVSIRRWQQKELGEKLKKYALIVHNDTRKQAHEWQVEVVQKLLDVFVEAIKKKDIFFRDQLASCVVDLQRSLNADNVDLPPLKEVIATVADALRGEEVVVVSVNSDTDVFALLDEKGELKLRTPFNIFVGGNILDRGITIPNMIGFYYGRHPKRMQADTVLQHSRMYGARDRKDLAVTRFYTSQPVYDRLARIDEFETSLRDAFESGAHDRGVAFISRDESREVIPCAPNKIMLSDVIAIRPGGRLLPVGFQSRSKSQIQSTIEKLDDLIRSEWKDTGVPVQVSLSTIQKIIDLIQSTLDTEDTNWDWEGFSAAVDYFSKTSPNKAENGKTWLLALTDRAIGRVRTGGRFQNAPDTKQQRDLADEYAQSIPMLMLFRLDGDREKGWGGHPFWWPVLVAPKDATPCVYASHLPSMGEGRSELAEQYSKYERS